MLQKERKRGTGMGRSRERCCSYLWGRSFQGLSGEGSLRAGSGSLTLGDKWGFEEVWLKREGRAVAGGRHGIKEKLYLIFWWRIL